MKFVYLRVRQNVIIIMTETSRATHELPKDDVAEGVSAPTFRVSASNLLRLIPALLLHAIGKAPRVGFRGDSEVFEQSGGVFGDEFAV